MFSGGWDNRRQLVEYDIVENVFIDHGHDELLADTWGVGRYYTQYDATMMYHIDPSGSKLFSFNLKSLKSQEFQPVTTIPVTVHNSACIASSEDNRALYITGGDDGTYVLYDVQVLELETNEWVTDVGWMNNARFAHGCIVEPVSERLYAVGGLPLSVTQIEYIDIVDIENASWAVMDNELPQGVAECGIVVLNGFIFVVGGWNGDSYNDFMYIIDTATGTVSMDTNRTFPHGAYGISAIVVNDTLYGFGGYHDGTLSPSPPPTC